MPDILLHQYDSSPFSEKVRVCLGIKGLAWAAVDQPIIMPKPELVPLTGGYRRIPVMQIGADVYCDSQLIVRELERRYPEPTLFPGGGSLFGYASALWTDREMFQAAVAVIFGGLGDNVPAEFIKDREALSGRPFDPAAMGAAVPMMTQRLRANAALLSEQLRTGSPFLAGELPGLLDANAYYNLWFVRSAYPAAASAFDDSPAIRQWMERIRGIGHGQRSQISPTQALQLAREALPQAIPEGTDDLLGRTVVISADDYGRDPIEGTLIAASEFQLTVLRLDAALGEIAVHFPRIGFHLREYDRK
ncbi:glutathione S-transferase family protein [Parafrankia sp. BMG5.11]|uniref:glutathione S-transferase family protein n=1 Tax=Parafrankia sp. BMG5.11 TaxID=222540 RepID=UPI00103B19A2|nr:glutathione S-transferase family protein [Parafrankia sp. BMG5.11]TCJ32292.1 glutathione S-transferase family protein [Parafrankia sp. BMG5.11]